MENTTQATSEFRTGSSIPMLFGGCNFRHCGLGALAAFMLANVSAANVKAQGFDCARKYCKEMSSCAEADYKFRVCKHRQLDADNDGIPCENICGDNLAIYTARRGAIVPPTGDPSSSGFDVVGTPPAVAPNNFACGAKRTCREMVSCEEAKFHFEKCGLFKLDGDRDGVPCNALCR